MSNQKLTSKLLDWFSSNRFFGVILAGFTLSAGWIAVSAQYPMAFDEDYHVGIINTYAYHISPFFRRQPPGLDYLGAFSRDPSYLYHYLMSFPWRLIVMTFHSFMLQAITLRLLNILMFAGGLVIFRLVLLKTSLSRATINLVFLLFVLTPLVSQAAAQINYDNLLFLLMALSIWLALTVVENLNRQKRLDWQKLGWLLCLCLLSCLVKYAFMPVFAGIVIYIAWNMWRARQRDKSEFKDALRSGYRALSRPIKIILVLALIISGGLFIERYGVNTWRYGTPLPECDQVLSASRCQAYGPWARNYQLTQARPLGFKAQPVSFTYDWVRHMGYNLTFSLNGVTSGYAAGQPLLLPKLVIIFFSTSGAILFLIFGRRLLKDRALSLCLLIGGLYIAALWLQNFADYAHIGQPVAIQGRYLIPVLLIVYAAFALSFGYFLAKHYSLRLILASMAVVGALAGGGALTFIVRSDETWYWPSRSVTRVNNGARTVLTPILTGKPVQPGPNLY